MPKMSDLIRFNIEPIPVLNLRVMTDAQMRLRLSTDIIKMFSLEHGGRVSLGYDNDARAIAIRPAAGENDPTAATIDKRGYISARKFFRKTRLAAESRRFEFAAEQDGWLVFVYTPQIPSHSLVNESTSSSGE